MVRIEWVDRGSYCFDAAGEIDWSSVEGLIERSVPNRSRHDCGINPPPQASRANSLQE